jgi:hypothetical protein
MKYKILLEVLTVLQDEMDSESEVVVVHKARKHEKLWLSSVDVEEGALRLHIAEWPEADTRQ